MHRLNLITIRSQVKHIQWNTIVRVSWIVEVFKLEIGGWFKQRHFHTNLQCKNSQPTTTTTMECEVLDTKPKTTKIVYKLPSTLATTHQHLPSWSIVLRAHDTFLIPHCLMTKQYHCVLQNLEFELWNLLF
jgi:hypothetical protein